MRGTVGTVKIWDSQEENEVRKVALRFEARLRSSLWSVRRRTVAAAVGLVAACLATVLWATPALASYGLQKSFEAESLGTPIGVALDEAGNVYVGNEDGKIDKFNPAGELGAPSPFGAVGAEYFSGVAVSPVSHNLYAVIMSPAALLEFKPNGETVASSYVRLPGEDYPFAFAEITIAADAHGNVYVPEVLANKIAVFGEEGKEPSSVAAEISGLSQPQGVAIANGKDVWVADTGAGKIEEFEPGENSGKPVFELVPGKTIEGVAHVQAVAADDTGDVFASIGGEGITPKVIEYNHKGENIAEFGEGVLKQAQFGQPDGIAVEGAGGLVYVASSGGNVVERFANGAVVTTRPPSDIHEGNATLNGEVEVEPGASVEGCRFEYGATTEYGSSVPCQPATPYTTTTPVSATLSGLSGDTHYRLAITNAQGEVLKVGTDELFGAPEVHSQYAEAVVTTATLRAHVTVLEEAESTCKEAQYVSEAEYTATGFAHSQSVACITPIGSTPGAYNVETARIAGLQPDTIYHYRFLTTNKDFGVEVGPDGEFATFGVAPGSFSFAALDEALEPFTQAGGRPYEWTDTFRLNTSTHMFTNGTTDPDAPDANAKDTITELPPGMIGNPDATPKCAPDEVLPGECSGASQVGVITVYTANPASVANNGGRPERQQAAPIYNVVPPQGVAAQFAANIVNVAQVHIDSRVRTGGDYGVTAEVLNTSTQEGLVAAEVTLWGLPAAASHDSERACPGPDGHEEIITGQPCTERGASIPLLTEPTACAGETLARMRVDSWSDPSVFVSAESQMLAITGCGKVHFTPSMAVTPTAKTSDSPTGLHVELTVPQNEDPNGLAEADLKDAKVVLPAGVTINPSSADGMVGCPLLTGKEAHPGQIGIDLENTEAANCPNASKVGKVTIKSPLLEEELTGGVYVAQQDANPFESLVALYIAAEAPQRGVVIKLAGRVSLEREEANGLVTKQEGQLTTTFDENPQLPFETLKLDFFGGERAPLATPRDCGSYQPSSVLEPWSHQGAPGEEGTPDAEPFIAPFAITSGPGGTSCAPAPGFAPPFTAGTVNPQAAAFSPFVMTLNRNDGEQRLSTVAMTLPKGVSGMLSKVPLCGEAQANAGNCPAASKIGHVIAQAGVGGEPVTLPQPGKPEDPVYLTEKYDGAPFGLSIVVPAEAGPFNLGTVIVRAKLSIDPHTAQVSVVSNPMPTMLQGVPLDVRTIHVEIDRPNFTFNPTSCKSMSVTGTIGSAEGATAAVSSRFQAANCAALPFHPKFTVATRAKHTRRKGAYLHVTIKSKQGEAGLHEVHVELPKALPSRLPTLQKACTEAQFAANPAGCPAASVVGHATIHTPVLPVPLKGPAYFVSHGGAKFPELVMVVQGYGVTIVLNGETFISPKTSITSSTFKSTPDVPFNRFDLVLPAGVHSALAGFGNFCRKRLAMPTRIVAQSGKVLEQRTKVRVQGCKPALQILGHKVKGLRASIRVQVPSAGRLIASGKGIARAVQHISGKHGGRVAITVHLSAHDRHVLAKNPHQRFNAKIKLSFVPKHGKRLSARVRLLIG